MTNPTSGKSISTEREADQRKGVGMTLRKENENDTSRTPRFAHIYTPKHESEIHLYLVFNTVQQAGILSVTQTCA